MTHFAIPSIFWTTIVGTAISLTFATMIGRTTLLMLPWRLRGTARFYLAPSIGIAVLTIVASVLGRFLEMGNSVVLPCTVIALLVAALVYERDKSQAFRHVISVWIFGSACGASVLGPLFAYGAFNPHNDTFTYLAQSAWLQHHVFGSIVSSESVTPFSTQIAMYQFGQFRMGASFLLAFTQALLNLRWSYEVYPTVVISAITASCLAVGLPLAQQMRTMSRSIRLMLLALPAFSLGGLVFEINFGFLPQSIGLAIGASLLFLVGPILRWNSTQRVTYKLIAASSIPTAILFSAGVFAYSELAPFLVLSIIGAGAVMAFRFNAWRKIGLYSVVVISVSALILNTELLRAYSALRFQSGVVVGTPVNWTLLGYIAHAFGVHGAAWDIFQWATPGNGRSITFRLGFIALVIVACISIGGIKNIIRLISNGALLPTSVILALLFSGLIYFRYFVQSPFPTGTGQSWSQFKLSDWANPFVMALSISAAITFRRKFTNKFDLAVALIFTIGAVSTIQNGIARIRPHGIASNRSLMSYYSNAKNLDRFYIDFRDVILSNCPISAPIYLNLKGDDLKFREIAVMYLFDREVKSDWTDDGYIYQPLSPDHRAQSVAVGDCVVEPHTENGLISHASVFGPFQFGVFDGSGPLQISSVDNAYGREGDEQDWWYWVAKKITFKLKTQFVPPSATEITIRFDYTTRTDQTITLTLFKRDGSTQEIRFLAKAGIASIFDEKIDISPTNLSAIDLESDGDATQLSVQDTRVAAWTIRNLTITPVLH